MSLAAPSTLPAAPSIPSLLEPTRKRFRSEVEDVQTIVGAEVDEFYTRLQAFLETQQDKKEDPLFLVLESCLAVFSSTRRHLRHSECLIEKEKRERSVVIELLPESKAPLASDRVDADYAHVKKIFNAVDLEVRPEAIFRMGQKKPSSPSDPTPHPRLLKVVLPRKSSQSALLFRSSKLKLIPEYKHIRVRPSLSQADRTAAWELRKKKNELNAKGGTYVIYAVTSSAATRKPAAAAAAATSAAASSSGWDDDEEEWKDAEEEETKMGWEDFIGHEALPHLKKPAAAAAKPAAGRMQLGGFKPSKKNIDEDLDEMLGISSSRKGSGASSATGGAGAASSGGGGGWDDFGDDDIGAVTTPTVVKKPSAAAAKPAASSKFAAPAAAAASDGWGDEAEGWGDDAPAAPAAKSSSPAVAAAADKEARRAEMAARNEARKKELAAKRAARTGGGGGAMKLASTKQNPPPELDGDWGNDGW